MNDPELESLRFEIFGDDDSGAYMRAAESGERLSAVFDSWELDKLLAGKSRDFTVEEIENYFGEHEAQNPRLQAALLPRDGGDDLQKSQVRLAKNYFLDKMRAWIAAGENVWAFINGANESIREELTRLARAEGLI